jgi:hypothetical protein
MNELEKITSANDDELVEAYLSSVSPDEFRKHIEEIKAKAANGEVHLSKLIKISQIINQP